jgi:alpha-L-fucosidase 2
LPSAWPNGSIKGLRARGGFEVDLEWSGGQLKSAKVRSDLGRPCRVRCGQKVAEFATKAGATYALNATLRKTCIAETE